MSCLAMRDRPRYSADVDELPSHAQYAIVGGGFAGLATAWALVAAGVRDVVVLERGPIVASHASGHNAAMCRALAEDDDWTELTAAGAAWLRDPPVGFSSQPLVDDAGAILLAQDPAPLLAMAGRHRIRAEAIAAADLAGRWPNVPRDRPGVWFPDDGCIDLAALTAGYIDGARRGGARIVVAAEVIAIDGTLVRTARGDVRAEVVIAAPGAWASAVGALAGVHVDFVPRKRHIFVLDGPPLAGPIVWNVDADEWYVRRFGDSVMVSACDHVATEPGDLSLDVATTTTLRARLPPSLAQRAITKQWACQRTFAERGPPHIAWDRDRANWLWVAGLGGHGVTASPEVGRRAALALVRGPGHSARVAG